MPVLPLPPQSITAPGIESETLTPVTATSPSFETLIVPFTVNVCTCECVTVTFHVTDPLPAVGQVEHGVVAVRRVRPRRPA